MPMRFRRSMPKTMASLLLGACAGCCACGKCTNMGDITPKPLGTISDPVWQQQETNADASDFVIYQHEWTGNTTDLNHAGMDHVKQIAIRAVQAPFPILIERSNMAVKEGTKYGFPVHGSDELDMQRHELVVEMLTRMGVANAADRVVVSNALTPGYRQFEAERAYNRGFSGMGGMGGMGGGMGGAGGGGGIF